MNNYKTAFLFMIFVFVIIFFVLFFSGGDKNKSLVAGENADLNERKIDEFVIAGCPTFHYLLDQLNEKGIQVVKTGSTAESLEILNLGGADFALSGRVSKPDEPQLPYEIIGFGYSFISNEEIIIWERDIDKYSFFTDLSSEKIIETFSGISKNNIFEVDDVYQYLDKGIAITSAENTDYSKSGVVHMFKEDGFRNRLSRTPIIYFAKPENSKLVEEIKRLLPDERI